MGNTFEKLDLEAISGGSAVEQVNYQLQKAIENCLDTNTEPKAVRKISLTIQLKPSSDRQTAELTFKVDAKFPGDAPGLDLVQISRSNKTGYVPKPQQSLDFNAAENIDPVSGEVINLGGNQ